MLIQNYPAAVAAYEAACRAQSRPVEAPAADLSGRAAGSWWLYARRPEQCIFAEVPLARVDCETGDVDLDITDSLGVFHR